MRTILFVSVLTLLSQLSFAQDELTVWRHPEAPSALPDPPAPGVPHEAPSPLSADSDLAERPESSASVPSPTDAADSAVDPKLLGTQPVIDLTHIAKTVQVINNAIQQLERLSSLKQKADIDLNRLASIPFTDPENQTGRFLTTMLWILGGGDPINDTIVEETLSYSTSDISEIFRRYFPGEGILPGAGSGPSPWDLWNNEADYLTERYRALLAALHRTMDVYAFHTSQNSKERQGIKRQRAEAPLAAGESQHAEMLLAALHQSLDAQSVDRQLRMLAANTELLVAAEELSDRAAALAKQRAFLERQEALFGDPPPVTTVAGIRLIP